MVKMTYSPLSKRVSIDTMSNICPNNVIKPTLSEVWQSDSVKRLFNHPNFSIKPVPLKPLNASDNMFWHKRNGMNSTSNYIRPFQVSIFPVKTAEEEKEDAHLLPSKIEHKKSEIVLLPIERKSCGHYEPCENVVCDVTLQQYADTNGVSPMLALSIEENEINAPVEKHCGNKYCDALSIDHNRCRRASIKLYRCDKSHMCDICGITLKKWISRIYHRNCTRKKEYVHNDVDRMHLLKVRMRMRELQILEIAKTKKHDYSDPDKAMETLQKNEELIIIPHKASSQQPSPIVTMTSIPSTQLISTNLNNAQPIKINSQISKTTNIFESVPLAVSLQNTDISSNMLCSESKVKSISQVRFSNLQQNSLIPISVPIPSWAPTPIPSRAPVPIPNRVPTPIPSRAPVPIPNRAPAPIPSRAPAPIPSRAPAPIPSRAPTPIPSRAPTPIPSRALVPIPSRALTPIPSRALVSIPSRAPTPIPNRAPAPVQTQVPVLAPASVSTPVPAIALALAPTPTSTSISVSVPTSTPTSVPTLALALPSTPAPVSVSIPTLTPISAVTPVTTSAPIPIAPANKKLIYRLAVSPQTTTAQPVTVNNWIVSPSHVLTTSPVQSKTFLTPIRVVPITNLISPPSLLHRMQGIPKFCIVAENRATPATIPNSPSVQSTAAVADNATAQVKNSNSPKVRKTPKLTKAKKNFFCEYCKKNITTEWYFKMHIAKHKGEKLFSCTFCDESFSNNYDLKKHITNKHTGQKELACDKCNYTCTSLVSFKDHIQSHERCSLDKAGVHSKMQRRLELLKHNEGIHLRKQRKLELLKESHKLIHNSHKKKVKRIKYGDTSDSQNQHVEEHSNKELSTNNIDGNEKTRRFEFVSVKQIVEPENFKQVKESAITSR